MQQKQELNKDFTTVVKAIELAQEAGGVYKLQDAAVIMVAMENLGKFIQRANVLMEQEELKREMESAREVETAKAVAAPKKTKGAK